MKLIPQSLRKALQFAALLFLLTPLIRITYLDIPNARLVVLGIGFQRDHIFIPALVGFAALGLVLFISSRWGRFFCSFLCPMHLNLEYRKSVATNFFGKLGLWVLPFLLAESAISFVVSYERQLASYQAAAFPPPVLIAQLIASGVFVGIFLIYREKFCHFACPYSMFQGVLRNDKTVVTVFDKEAERCINCKSCDRTCPMQLNVRKESVESFCSNCTLCIDTCESVLGEGNGVLRQILEEGLPEDNMNGDSDADS